MTTFRRASRADRDAILALRSECFADDDPEKRDPRFWDWAFAERGVPFVAEEGATVVSHFGLVAMPMTVGGRALRAALALDAMTAASRRNAGIYTRLVQHAIEETRDEFDLLFAFQIRRSVLGAMLRSGWKVSARLPVLVKPLRVTAFFTSRTGNDALEVLDESACEEMAALASSGGNAGAVLRSSDWIRWRYFRNPAVTYRVIGTRHAGALASWIVTRRTHLRGYDTVAVVDVAGSDSKTVRTLIRDAMRAPDARGATFGAALVSSGHRYLPLFLSCGFLPSPHVFRLLTHTTVDLVAARWSLLWGDTDHL